MTNDRPVYILPLVNYNMYCPIIGHFIVWYHLIFISLYKLLPIILYVQCNLSFFPIVFIQAFSICLIIFRLGSPHSAQRDNQIPPPQHFGAKLPKMKRIPKITDKDIKLPNQEALAAAAANLSKCVFFFVEFIKLLKIVGLKIFFMGKQ